MGHYSISISVYLQLGRVLSVTSRRQWVVLRRESGGRSSRIELYRSEDQSAEPNKTISLSSSVSYKTLCVLAESRASTA